MKCPKCGDHSFEHLDNCRKCGLTLAGHKAKFKLRCFFVPGHASSTGEPAALVDENLADEGQADEGLVDFSLTPPAENDASAAGRAGSIPLVGNGSTLSIDRPFSVDVETLPADPPGPAGRPGGAPDLPSESTLPPFSRFSPADSPDSGMAGLICSLRITSAVARGLFGQRQEPYRGLRPVEQWPPAQ